MSTVKVSYQIEGKMEQEEIKTKKGSGILWQNGLLQIIKENGSLVFFNQQFIIGYVIKP